MPVQRALVSVFDKTGLDAFARGLSDLGIELVASGGTAAYIGELGIEVVPVEEITDVPELLGGRVKTLHPRIHAGILARRDDEGDLSDLRRQGIRTVDLVCVNLYPFARVAGRKDVREEDAVEMIDIGGPALLRAAAKNFLHVVPVCRSERYEELLGLLAEGDVDVPTRRALAAEAFAHTAAYEASIASWFGDVETFPPRLLVSLEKLDDLAYGENPHQRAAYYAEAGVRRHLLSRVEQLGGRALSFNNLNDLDAARALLREFALPSCAIVKHASPCGCAVAASIDEAYERALAADPVSAYGGVVALNRPVTRPLAERLAEQFVEVLIAPDYGDGALAALERKEAMRVLQDRERRGTTPGERDYRRVLGGFLVQDADAEVDDREGMRVATAAAPDEARWGDLLFAWRVAKHVVSNAIVVVKDLQTLGIGGGQMSRVDAVRLALEKAREHGHDLAGAVLASDAFFPFADGPRLALEAGVAAIVQPSGSKRDAEVAEAVESAGRSSCTPPAATSATEAALAQLLARRFDCAVTTAAPPRPETPAIRPARWLAAPLAAFALVALAAGVLARARPDEGGGYFDLFFRDTIHMKAWLASAVAVLALTQLFTAAWIFRKLPWRRPSWVPALHRWTGRAAFLVSLPVAYHCIFQLGFQSGDDRVLAHSLLGSAVYGAFAAKILIVRLHRFPVWVLPTAGGVLFAVLIAVWYTSALWFFRLVGVEV